MGQTMRRKVEKNEEEEEEGQTRKEVEVVCPVDLSPATFSSQIS